MRDQLRLVRRTHEETSLVQDPGTRRIIVHILAHAGVQPVQEYVPELVSARDRVVVDVGDARQPARLRVVGEDEQLTGRDGSIDAVEGRLLHVADNDPRPDDVDRSNACRETLRGVRMRG
jgi:hypothetical protein